MKRLFFIIALLVPALLSQALTVNDLFKKYKNYPEAQYRKLNSKELKAQIDSVSSEDEKEVLRTAKEMMMLMVILEEEDLKQLTAELNTLKGYNMAMSFSENDNNDAPPAFSDDLIGKEIVTIEEGTGRIVKGTIVGQAQPDNEPSFSVEIYSKETSRDVLSKPVLLIRMSELTGLIYIDGEIKPNDAEKMIKISTGTSTTFM